MRELSLSYPLVMVVDDDWRIVCCMPLLIVELLLAGRLAAGLSFPTIFSSASTRFLWKYSACWPPQIHSNWCDSSPSPPFSALECSAVSSFIAELCEARAAACWIIYCERKTQTSRGSSLNSLEVSLLSR